MEVRQPSPNPEQRQLEQLRAESIRASREASEKAVDSLSSAKTARSKAMEVQLSTISGGRDVVDFSDAARQLAEASPEDREARAEHLAQLKAQMERGELNTPERVDRAASRLLGGE